MLILNADSCVAIGRLIGCIAAYNCQLCNVQLYRHIPNPAQYADTDSIKDDVNRMYGMSAIQQPVLLSDLRNKWSDVCDAAVDLKHISGLNVIIGGAGPIFNGYNMAVQVQLLDSADIVRMAIDITYDGQHYVSEMKYY